MDLVQHGIVAIVVAGALFTVVRRLVGFVKPPARGETACKTCASGKTGAAGCATTQPQPSASQNHPAVLYRSGANQAVRAHLPR